uniref:Uncharacterized protein n=1 Tax=Anopheles arabiensis TaxID=7173 RepID=A0A182HSG3_ANOAR
KRQTRAVKVAAGCHLFVVFVRRGISRNRVCVKFSGAARCKNAGFPGTAGRKIAATQRRCREGQPHRPAQPDRAPWPRLVVSSERPEAGDAGTRRCTGRRRFHVVVGAVASLPRVRTHYG